MSEDVTTCLRDITETDIMEYMQVEKPHNERELWKMKHATPARIGIGHCGPRYTTEAQLRFLASHAAANDAVFNEVPDEVVEELGVFEVQTKCSNKNEMLLRPDWGRVFLPDAKKKIVENCVHGPQVQIYFGDGLCSPSIKANIPDLFPTIKMGLEDKGITVGTPFFVRYCRVNTARTIGPLTMADWEKRLNGFIEMFEYGLLQDAGKVTAEIAKLHAETEFEKYRIVQDRLYKSDFDMFLEELENIFSSIL